MIEQTVEDLTTIIGTRPACSALGAAPATIYRRRRPPAPRPARPRAPSPRALSQPERDAVLVELHSERFVDSAPAQVWATLLDEGRYLASERTMYRLLEAEHGPARERRDQLRHPSYAAPELLADRPARCTRGTSPSSRAGDVDVLLCSYFLLINHAWARRVSNLRPLACEARTRSENSGRFAGRNQNLAQRGLRDLPVVARSAGGFRPSDGLNPGRRRSPVRPSGHSPLPSVAAVGPRARPRGVVQALRPTAAHRWLSLVPPSNSSICCAPPLARRAARSAC